MRDVLTCDARILEHFSNLTCPVFLFFYFGSLHRPQGVLVFHLGIFNTQSLLYQEKFYSLMSWWSWWTSLTRRVDMRRQNFTTFLQFDMSCIPLLSFWVPSQTSRCSCVSSGYFQHPKSPVLYQETLWMFDHFLPTQKKIVSSRLCCVSRNFGKMKNH